MKILRYLIVIILLVLLVFWWSTRAVSGDLATVLIKGKSYKVLLADNPAAWRQGLSDQSRQSLMLFVFPDKQTRTFWMKDMNYSLDIVWLDDQIVVGLDRGQVLAPGAKKKDWPRYTSPQPVNMVLEIPVDLMQNLGLNIEIGDKIEKI